MTQQRMYYEAVRKLADRDIAMLEMLYGENQITDDELRALIAKRPQVYGRYEGYIGKR